MASNHRVGGPGNLPRSQAVTVGQAASAQGSVVCQRETTRPLRSGMPCLNASMAPHASDWLHALPLTTFNLKLSDEAVRVAVGLRLGSAICEPHTCVCGAPVSAR